MKIDKKELFQWALIFALIFGIAYPWIRFYQIRKQNRNLISNVEGLKQDFSKFVTAVGDTLSIQTQTILTLREAVARGIVTQNQLEEQNLRLVQQYASAQETISNLEEIIANYEPEVIVITDTVKMEPGFQYLRLPAPWSFSDEWIKLSGINTGTGVVFPPGGIWINNEPQFTFALRNRHESWLRNFFSRPEQVVIYENKNPYASTHSMTNVVIQEPPKWYERKITWFIIGTGAGVFIAR